MYWAQELANQNNDTELKTEFSTIAKALEEHEESIIKELTDIQGHPTDIGGYYEPDEHLITQVMRPSKTFNSILS